MEIILRRSTIMTRVERDRNLWRTDTNFIFSFSKWQAASHPRMTHRRTHTREMLDEGNENMIKGRGKTRDTHTHTRTHARTHRRELALAHRRCHDKWRQIKVELGRTVDVTSKSERERQRWITLSFSDNSNEKRMGGWAHFLVRWV